VPIEVGFHAAFGIGLAVLFRAGLLLTGRRVRIPPPALHG
jgi:hypothetical protein